MRRIVYWKNFVVLSRPSMRLSSITSVFSRVMGSIAPNPSPEPKINVYLDLRLPGGWEGRAKKAGSRGGCPWGVPPRNPEFCGFREYLTLDIPYIYQLYQLMTFLCDTPHEGGCRDIAGKTSNRAMEAMSLQVVRKKN
eukprot:1394002-Amorphochlora_amoeboformis.AAC.1